MKRMNLKKQPSIFFIAGLILIFSCYTQLQQSKKVEVPDTIQERESLQLLEQETEFQPQEEGLVINDFLEIVSESGKLIDPPCAAGDIFRITKTWRNKSGSPVLTGVFARVAEISGGNQLLSAGSGVGAEQEMDLGPDEVLQPGEEFTAIFDIEVADCSELSFNVEMLGTQSSTAVSAAAAQTIILQLTTDANKSVIMKPEKSTFAVPQGVGEELTVTASGTLATTVVLE